MEAMIDPEPLPPSGAPHLVRTTRRRGRMSQAKRSALITLLPRWSIERPLDPATLDEEFGRSAPRLLDVGVGTGEATLAWAEKHPDHDVVAVELHRPGVARMLQDLDRDGPSNVRVLEADVTMLLTELVEATPAKSTHLFDAIRVLFPDPWPKKRHVLRRLVDRSFVSSVADLLPVGGWLHLATDWDDYAQQMLEALEDEPRLRIDSQLLRPEGSNRPTRPVTVYEARGLASGREITDLVALRREP